MCKDWKKNHTKEEIKVVEKAMTKLRYLIDTVESTGTPFEKIFNNDTIKYDVLGNNFFTFKYKGLANTQARILYRFIRKDPDTYDLEIHMVYVKRKDSNIQRTYIDEFERYVKKYS